MSELVRYFFYFFLIFHKKELNKNLIPWKTKKEIECIFH